MILLVIIVKHEKCAMNNKGLQKKKKVLRSFSNNNRVVSRGHEEEINKIKNNCDKYYPELNLRDLRCLIRHIEITCVNTLQNEFIECTQKLVEIHNTLCTVLETLQLWWLGGRAVV